MEKACPYCGAVMDITRLAQHVKLAADEDHGPHGTVPERDMDNPWNLRLDFSEEDREPDSEDTLRAELIKEDVRRGRCPACDLGIMGTKGGDGFLSSGRRRLACMNCGWESPEWITIN